MSYKADPCIVRLCYTLDYTSNLPVASQVLSLKLKWQILNPLYLAKQAV